jgi:hypothetical protein
MAVTAGYGQPGLHGQFPDEGCIAVLGSVSLLHPHNLGPSEAKKDSAPHTLMALKVTSHSH